MIIRGRVPGAISEFDFRNSADAIRMRITSNGRINIPGRMTLGGVNSDGVLDIVNPNGSYTHFGWVDNANYIRGLLTYIDTPIIFNSSMSINSITYPQNTSQFSHVMTYNTSTSAIQRSQCMMRQVYRNESIAWGGGINMTFAFFKFNSKCPVKISGKYAGFAGGVGLQQMGLRIFSQSTGAFYFFTFNTFQNIGSAHFTYPFEVILTEAFLGTTTGWFDIFIYNVFGFITDTNDQLHVNVEVLPVDAF
jgi:hypothetical protein